MGDGRTSVMTGRRSAAPHRSRAVPAPCRQVAGPGSTESGSDEGSPLFAVPGMVLLAALAIFEGYRWLQIIPGGSLRPSGMIFAVAVVPATYALTRHGIARRVVVLKHLALACAAAVPLLGALVLAGLGTEGARALGASSLLLALSVLALAAVSERGGQSASTR